MVIVSRLVALGAPSKNTNSKIADCHGITQGICDTMTIGDYLIKAI